MRIRANTFLVAGGGSGLGAATTDMLAASGARVVVADLKGEPPEEGRFVETDVTDEGSVREAVEATRELGELRGAINCAGVASAEKVLGREGPHSLDSFAQVVQSTWWAPSTSSGWRRRRCLETNH